jgi:transcription termination/antitermination protein NusA
MNTDLMRIIDAISRDKNIDRDTLVADIEMAMVAGLRKNYGEEANVEVKLDLLTGKFKATVEANPVDVQVLGRIAAQTVKQMIIQKTRERERTSIFEDFTERRGTIVTGTVVRNEGGNLIVNVGRTEGFLPRSEQIPGETHQSGERIRVLILEVREQPNQVKIILSRSNPEFIQRLFELEVPEVAEQVIEIKALAREAGYRTKVAVSSIDSKVDAVGACVGVRGSRIKNIVEELGGEKIDIVRWNESSQILIQNALKPAEVQEIALCFELGKATVVVAEDQLSLAIGKRGQNVRLAARLTGWDVDILTPAEYNKHLENMERVLKSVEGVDDVLVDKIIAFGCVSVGDIDEIGPDPLVNELQLDAELAERILEAAGEEVIRQEEEKEAEAKRQAELAAAGITTPPPGEGAPAAEGQIAPDQGGGAATGLPDEALPLSVATTQSAPEALEAAGSGAAATLNALEPATSIDSSDLGPAALAPDSQAEPLTGSPEPAPDQPSEPPREEVP